MKSLISKGKINKYTTKKTLIEEGLFLVLPYNKFYTACSNIKDPDISSDYAFWVFTFEDLNEMFLCQCPNELDIKYYIIIWSMNRFDSTNEEDIEDYISKYDSDDPKLMGGVEALTWKEIKKIWDL